MGILTNAEPRSVTVGGTESTTTFCTAAFEAAIEELPDDTVLPPRGFSYLVRGTQGKVRDEVSNEVLGTDKTHELTLGQTEQLQGEERVVMARQEAQPRLKLEAEVVGVAMAAEVAAGGMAAGRGGR